MAIIGKIRERSGLLLIVMAVTLLLFILSDALPKMGSGEENIQASVFGEEVDMQEYYKLAEQKINEANIQRQQSPQSQPLSEIEADNIREQVWNDYISDAIYNHELQYFGFEVTPEELNALFFSEGAHDYVKNIPIFRDSVTQKFRPDLVKKFRANQVEKDQYMRQQWTKVEIEVKKQALKDKYLTLVKNGLYMNKVQAKRNYEDNNKKYKIKLVAARIDNISDSAVKVSESDIKAAYEKNKYRRQYENMYGSTKFEYVEFPIIPSKADIDYVKGDMETLKESFKNAENDSSFIVTHSTTKNTMPQIGTSQMYPSEIDSLIQLSDSGAVLGPYEDQYAINQGKIIFKLLKIIGFAGTQKEVKARHILLRAEDGDSKTLLARADSIRKVIKANNNFSEMVATYSGDFGSVPQGGSLGWFTEGMMVTEFNDACFKGKVGDMPIVETQFGVHLIEILGSRDGKRAKILTVDVPVEAGEETIDLAREKAMEFFDKVETAADFTKNAQKENLTIKEKELQAKTKFIDQNTSSRELSRRIHEAENDDIIEPIIWGNNVVISHIKNIRKEGIPSLEDIRVMMEAEARREKKLDLVAKQLKGAKSLTDAAQRSNANVMDMEVNFAANNLPGIGGAELNVIGTIFSFGSKDIGKVSLPIRGKNGIYMFQLEKIIEAPATKDYTANKQTMEMELKKRAVGTYNDGDIYKALKKKAEIVDNRQMF